MPPGAADRWLGHGRAEITVPAEDEPDVEYAPTAAAAAPCAGPRLALSCQRAGSSSSGYSVHWRPARFAARRRPAHRSAGSRPPPRQPDDHQHRTGRRQQPQHHVGCLGDGRHPPQVDHRDQHGQADAQQADGVGIDGGVQLPQVQDLHDRPKTSSAANSSAARPSRRPQARANSTPHRREQNARQQRQQPRLKNSVCVRSRMRTSRLSSRRRTGLDHSLHACPPHILSRPGCSRWPAPRRRARRPAGRING